MDIELAAGHSMWVQLYTFWMNIAGARDTTDAVGRDNSNSSTNWSYNFVKHI